MRATSEWQLPAMYSLPGLGPMLSKPPRILIFKNGLLILVGL